MAIAYVSTSSVSAAGVSSVTVSRTSTSGNGLLVSEGCYNAVTGGPTSLTLTDTLGETIGSPLETVAPSASLQESRLQAHVILVAHGGASNTWKLAATGGLVANTDINLDVAEYSGLDAALTTDGHTHGSTNGTNTVNTGSITTTNANDLIWTTCWDQTNAQTFTYTSGFTGRNNNQNPDAETSVQADQIVSATNTYSNTFTGGTSSNDLLAIIIAIKAASSGASGSAAITEPHDTVAGVGALSTTGSAAIHESSDTVAGSGALSTSGSASITEGADVISATGVAGIGGTAAIAEGADVVSGSGSLSTSGSAAITEGADTVSGSGALSTSGSAAMAEGSDTVSGSGTATTGVTGSGVIAEGTDTVSGTGALSTTGTGAAIEAADSVSGTGQAGSGPQPAGRHRKRYGVFDGDRLLIFDTRAKADEAQVAIASRELPKPRNARRIRVKPIPKPTEVIPLPQIAAAAESVGEYRAYQTILSDAAPTRMADFYEGLRARYEEEETARHLLHLDREERRMHIAHLTEAVNLLNQFLRKQR